MATGGGSGAPLEITSSALANPTFSSSQRKTVARASLDESRHGAPMPSPFQRSSSARRPAAIAAR